MQANRFCILGRSNVGKSTLFNCFTSQKTLVKNEKEVTRDNNKTLAEFQDFFFYLVDTGGLTLENPNKMQQEIQKKIIGLLEDIDAIFFLLDAKEGWHFEDQQILQWLRKQNKKFYLLVNKIDDDKHLPLVSDFYRSGIKQLYPISAAHRIGIGEFLTELAKDFPVITEPIVCEKDLTVSVLGKTNVGKSSMINYWLGEQKMIVQDAAFTTRNSVLFEIQHQNQKIFLFDTVGLKKKRKIAVDLEKLATDTALQAIKNSKIVLLVMDISQPLSEQDLKIASLAIRKNKSLILVFNKIDLVEKKMQKEVAEYIKKTYNFLIFCPICFTSNKEKIGHRKLLDKVLQVMQERKKKIATSDLNKIVKRLQETREAPHSKKRGLKIFYCTQIQSNPPVFRFFINQKKLLTDDYKRFVKNQFRYYFNYMGTPIRFFWNNK
jgi:GTP-binding protein